MEARTHTNRHTGQQRSGSFVHRKYVWHIYMNVQYLTHQSVVLPKVYGWTPSDPPAAFFFISLPTCQVISQPARLSLRLTGSKSQWSADAALGREWFTLPAVKKICQDLIFYIIHFILKLKQNKKNDTKTIVARIFSLRLKNLTIIVQLCAVFKFKSFHSWFHSWFIYWSFFLFLFFQLNSEN